MSSILNICVLIVTSDKKVIGICYLYFNEG